LPLLSLSLPFPPFLFWLLLLSLLIAKEGVLAGLGVAPSVRASAAAAAAPAEKAAFKPGSVALSHEALMSCDMFVCVYVCVCACVCVCVRVCVCRCAHILMNTFDVCLFVYECVGEHVLNQPALNQAG
jgi:hypothetical protein